MSRRTRTFDAPAARALPPAVVEPDRACKDVDPDVFYPEHASGNAEAIAYCHACPHTDLCLTWALETGQSFGIWGGTTPAERKAMIENNTRSTA